MAGTDRLATKARKAQLSVLVIRHGIAEDPAAFAQSGLRDSMRPLTGRGRKKMRQGARGLANLVPEVDALAASPLTRAIETAEIIGKRLNQPRVIRLPGLAPGKSAAQVMDWLREQVEKQSRKPEVVVALVGHEPGLGQLVSWMLTGLRESFIPLRKGGACLLAFDGEIKPARAKLLWAMKPSHLRDLARR